MQDIVFAEFHSLAFLGVDWLYFLCDFRMLGKFGNGDRQLFEKLKSSLSPLT